MGRLRPEPSLRRLRAGHPPHSVQHELEFADRRVVSMHIGCAGLYEPERRQRGWSSQSTRSDTTAIITAVLFVERPLCLDCIALKARKLGYMLFQLAPWLKRSDDVLAYLATLTRELPRMVVAIEFRHRSWFGERTPSRR
jgi:hypothetical protein